MFGGFVTRMNTKLIGALRGTWLFWVFFLGLGFVEGHQSETSTLSSRSESVAGLVFAFLVAFWVVRDARQRERPMGYGFPALVFLIWPIRASVLVPNERAASVAE
jgi:hypothetical protein